MSSQQNVCDRRTVLLRHAHMPTRRRNAQVSRQLWTLRSLQLRPLQRKLLPRGYRVRRSAEPVQLQTVRRCTSAYRRTPTRTCISEQTKSAQAVQDLLHVAVEEPNVVEKRETSFLVPTSANSIIDSIIQ